MTGRRIALAVVVTVAAGAGLWVLGVEVSFSIAWGVLAGVCVLVAAIPRLADPLAPAPPAPEPGWSGSEVARLAWAINSRSGAAGELVTRRVREIVRGRLAAIGVDVDDSAQSALVDRHLGSGVWASLTSGRTHRLDLERALDAADRLVSASADAPSIPPEEHP